MTDLDHGPKAGCNYTTCGVPDDAPNCPFTRDELPLPRFTEPECKHEWHQVSNVLDLRFYCKHCLTIRTLK